MKPTPVFSPAIAAAFATTLIVLGIVGWSVGWLAASRELNVQGLGGSPSPSHSVSRTPSPSPSLSPVASSPTATPTMLAPNAVPMPDLVGQKFMDARRAAFELGLSVNVHFNEPGDKPAGTVIRTNPLADEYVLKGWAVSLYVTGPPPVIEVPELAGMPCKQAKDRLVEIGLTIHSYPSGERGNVYKTDPNSGAKLAWNGRVKLFCSESASPGAAAR